MKPTFYKGVILGAIVAILTLAATAALAGNSIGAVFNLGKSNTADATSTLTGTTAGRQLQVTNKSTRVGATGIGIRVAPGKPPLAVNSSTRVAHLNASYLEGIPSRKFIRGEGAQWSNRVSLTVTPGHPDARPLLRIPGFGVLTLGCNADVHEMIWAFKNTSCLDLRAIRQDQYDGIFDEHVIHDGDLLAAEAGSSSSLTVDRFFIQVGRGTSSASRLLTVEASGTWDPSKNTCIGSAEGLSHRP